MHLMYFRFFTKAMRDLGLIDFDEPAVQPVQPGHHPGPRRREDVEEPRQRRQPGRLRLTYGADTFRCYLMFIGPWSDGGPYRPEGIEGLVALAEPRLERSRRNPRRQRPSTRTPCASWSASATARSASSRTTSSDFRFNTMLARLMEFTTYLGKVREADNVGRTAWNQAVESLLLMMAPAAPHIAEELWERTGPPVQRAPAVLAGMRDPALAKAETFTLVVQVNGKVRDKFDVSVDIAEDEARHIALNSERVKPYLDGHEIAAFSSSLAASSTSSSKAPDRVVIS